MAIPVTIKIDNHIVLTPTLLNAKLDALGHKPPVCSFMEFHDTFQFVDGGWSDSGYHNPEYDQLYLDQQKVVDKTERQKLVWKMQEMVYNDRPYIVLYYEKRLQAYRSDRFTGFIESPIGIEAGLSLLNVEPVK